MLGRADYASHKMPVLQDQPNEAYRPAISLGELDLARCKVSDLAVNIDLLAFSGIRTLLEDS